MASVKNVSTGARGAYLDGALVMAEPGEVIEADDFVAEWFAEEKPVKAAPALKAEEAKATEAKK